jgi:2-hydroxychromene-2-carboxylate isomerase
MPDIELYWDPICPFAWITSRWVAKVAEQRELEVDWRFISLRVLNEGRDYEREFPDGYPMLHERGIRMLRVAAAVREAHGRAAMGPLYTAFGESIWDRAPVRNGDAFAGIGDIPHLEVVLDRVGCAASLAGAADDETLDAVLRDETRTALSRTGEGVGTPVVAIDPPHGPGFFGPVISRVPADDEALVLWDAVSTLARWPGFAEIKRTAREWPQVPLFASRA